MKLSYISVSQSISQNYNGFIYCEILLLRAAHL